VKNNEDNSNKNTNDGDNNNTLVLLYNTTHLLTNIMLILFYLNPQNEVDGRTKETHNSNKDKNTHRENVLIRTRRTI
jgi:hypothetical protein